MVVHGTVMDGRLLRIMAGACVAVGCAEGNHSDVGVPSIDDQPELAVEARVRIDGHEETLLPISWIGADDDGTIAVLQRQDGTVRFFDSSGHALGAVGGIGDGPGEFRDLSIGGWKSDTLWVFDFSLRRASLIDPPGEVARMLPQITSATPSPADSSELPDFPFVFPYALYTGDSLLVSGQWGRGDPKAAQFDSPQMLRISEDGVIDGIVLAIPTAPGSSVLYEFGEGGVGAVGVPFAHRAHWAVSSDGRRIATVEPGARDSEGGTVVVRMFDELGDSLYVREFSYLGRAIPNAVRDSVLQYRAERSSNPVARNLYRGEVSDLIPSVYPPVSDIMVDREYRTWLRLQDDAESSWLVLSDEGAPLGIARLRGDVRLYEGAETVVWGVETDGVGVESVVVFSVAIED